MEHTMIGTALALAGAGGAMQGLNQLGNAYASFNLGGRSEKRSQSRALASAPLLMAMQNNFAKELYDWQSLYDYKMAQAYAQNSAKWNVEGLRNAGLNPILAATDGNFRSTFGDSATMSSPSASSPSGSSFSMPSAPSYDLAETLRDVASAKQSAISTSVQSQTAPSVVRSSEANADIAEANADKVRAETEQIRANTALSAVRTANEQKTEGVSSPYSAINNAIHKIAGWISDLSNSAKSRSSDKLGGEVINLINHSSKSLSEPLDDDKLMRELESWSRALKRSSEKRRESDLHRYHEHH